MEARRHELVFVVTATLANAVLAWAVFTGAGWDADGTEIALRSTARVSLVYFLLAFVASPMDRVWPGRASRLLLRYRRALGVVFGLSMSIHVLCILRLFRLYAPIRPPMVTLADFFIGIPGLILVGLMTITSLDALHRRLGPRRWGRLHRTGLWVVWAIFFLCLVDSVGRKASRHPALEYYPFIAALGLALLLRLAAGAARRRDGVR
jgi:DMSO/TMAO reductase YedYZ heme-binding membrane subunit